MSASYLSSSVWGTLILTRVFSHFLILIGLLAYQFLVRDFVNPFLSVSLYLVCAAVFLADSVYVSLDSKYYQNRTLTGFLFFLDSVFFAVPHIISWVRRSLSRFSDLPVSFFCFPALWQLVEFSVLCFVDIRSFFRCVIMARGI